MLRNKTIPSHTVAASPPHGQVKIGDLPLVQTRKTPGNPQVHSQQQKTVEILAPRDEEAAVRTGGLAMVNVKMTSQGPQPNNGQHSPVVVLPSKDQRQIGGLPMVHVKQTANGREIQTMPTSQSAPPQIQGAAPAVSQPRVARVAVPSAMQPRVARVAAPVPQAIPLPPVPELSMDEAMLLRHAADRFLGEAPRGRGGGARLARG